MEAFKQMETVQRRKWSLFSVVYNEQRGASRMRQWAARYKTLTVDQGILYFFKSFEYTGILQWTIESWKWEIRQSKIGWYIKKGPFKMSSHCFLKHDFVCESSTFTSVGFALKSLTYPLNLYKKKLQSWRKMYYKSSLKLHFKVQQSWISTHICFSFLYQHECRCEE